MSPAKPPRRITLKDIARTLGVSLASVSNAYNRPDQLSEALRARILDTASSLGYSGPDPQASGLRRGRSGAVGVLYGDPLTYAFADPAAALFLQGLSGALEQAGLNLLLLPMPNDPSRVSAVAVDGLILYSLPDGSAGLHSALARGLPCVLVDQTPLPGQVCVQVQDRLGARLAARHLLALGHRRIGVLCLDLAMPRRRAQVTAARRRASTFRPTLERLEGYQEEFQAAGLAWGRVPVLEPRENSVEEGEALTRELLSRARPPTAILAMSDQLAFGALRAAQAAGLRVPQDLSIVGFDDVPAAAALGLSTVRQPTVEKGALAGRLLLELLGGAIPASPAPLGTVLIERATTAPPPPASAP